MAEETKKNTAKKNNNLGHILFERYTEQGMSSEEARKKVGHDLWNINRKAKNQKLGDQFKESNIYKLLSENGVESEWYENSVKWDCSRNGRQYVFTMAQNWDGSERDPRIEIIINAKNNVELSDRDLLNCMCDVCDDLNVVKAIDSFEDIELTNDYPGDPCFVEVDYSCRNGISNEKADVNMYISVEYPDNVPLLKEGRVGFAKILCEAQNDVGIACRYLGMELPEEEVSKDHEEKMADKVPDTERSNSKADNTLAGKINDNLGSVVRSSGKGKDNNIDL